MEDFMLRDMVVNLSTAAADDTTRDYAITLAREFGLHLSAVAFAVEPVAPGLVVEGGPPELFAEWLREAEAAAETAVNKFNDAVRGSGLLTNARWLTTTVGGSADLFGRIARRCSDDKGYPNYRRKEQFNHLPWTPTPVARLKLRRELGNIVDWRKVAPRWSQQKA